MGWRDAPFDRSGVQKHHRSMVALRVPILIPVASSIVMLLASGCATKDLWGDAEVFDEIETVCPLFPGDNPVSWSESWPAPYPVEANQGLTFEVWFSGNMCFSGSCSRHETSCDVVVDGSTITFDAAVRVEELKARKGEPLGSVSCTVDCQSYAAQCNVEPLPAGAYEVVDANALPGSEPLLAFSLPSEIEVCFPQPGW